MRISNFVFFLMLISITAHTSSAQEIRIGLDRTKDIKVKSSDGILLKDILERLPDGPGEVATPPADVKSPMRPAITDKVAKNEVLAKIFDFDRNSCFIPDAVKERVRDEAGDDPWIPRGVNPLLNQLKDVKAFTPIHNKNVNRVLHTILYKTGTDTEKQIYLTGASTFDNINPSDYTDKTDTSKFLYSLDCSGFLNVALEATGGIRLAEADIAARNALNEKKSMFIAHAYLFPPPAIAIDPETALSDLAFNRRKTIDILSSILTALPDKAPDSDTVKAPKQVRLLWTSNDGNSSFQGEASFGASASAGIGFASIEAQSSAGIVIKRSTNYTTYDTYVVEEDTLLPISTTVGNIKKLLVREANQVNVIKSSERQGENYKLILDLPRIVCKSTDWNLTELNGNTINSSTVKSELTTSPDGCEFTMSFKPQPERYNAVQLTGKLRKFPDVMFNLIVAMPPKPSQR